MIEQRKFFIIANSTAKQGRRAPESVIERDYCLSWFLFMSDLPEFDEVFRVAKKSFSRISTLFGFLWSGTLLKTVDSFSNNDSDLNVILDFIIPRRWSSLRNLTH